MPKWIILVGEAFAPGYALLRAIMARPRTARGMRKIYFVRNGVAPSKRSMLFVNDAAPLPPMDVGILLRYDAEALKYRQFKRRFIMHSHNRSKIC